MSHLIPTSRAQFLVVMYGIHAVYGAVVKGAANEVVVAADVAFVVVVVVVVGVDDGGD